MESHEEICCLNALLNDVHNVLYSVLFLLLALVTLFDVDETTP